MNLTFSESDLQPVIERVVAATIDRLEEDKAKLGAKLSYREAEAAALLGIPAHSLRDARLRGEVKASRIGSRILYSRDELLRLLRNNQE